MKKNAFFLVAMAILFWLSCNKRDEINPCDTDFPENRPAVTTGEISRVGNTLTIAGEITKKGHKNGVGITNYGVCWSMTNDKPNIDDTKLNKGAHDQSSFSVAINANELESGDYYFRTFATNCVGTAYGVAVKFNVYGAGCSGILPEIATVKITWNGQLQIDGELTSVGDSSGVTDYGICWSDSNAVPDVSNHKLSAGSTTTATSFSQSLSTGGLSSGTYYFRAYAKNCAGIEYGGVLSYSIGVDPCDGNISSNLPAITLVGVSQSGQNLTIQGNLTNIGNASGGGVTDYGICWSSTNSTPSIADNKLSQGATTSTGAFSKVLSSLSAGTYYFNAYAINCAGTVYGSAQSYTLASSWTCGDLLEYEGQNYTTVQIGSQCWMAENLNVGTMINGNSDQTNNGFIEKYCYDNNPANCDTYGGLYQWDEMMQYTTVESTQGVCPTGWHLPSDDEWKTLEMQLGMSQSEADKAGWRDTNEGSKMAGNAALWKNGDLENDPEFDNSGLTVLPSGFRYTDGSSFNQSLSAYLWSSSESGSNAWYRILYYGGTDVGRYNDIIKAYGFSVRCVRD